MEKGGEKRIKGVCRAGVGQGGRRLAGSGGGDDEGRGK